MSTDRDTTRIVRSWMREDEYESADRVLGIVLDQLDTTPQRRATGWPARRLPQMNTAAKVVLAAAAVVVVAFLGIRFLGPGISNVGGDREVTEPSTASPTSMALPERGDLEAGTYLLSDEDYLARPLSVAVPAGWRTEGGFIFKGEGVLPDTRDLFLAPFILTHVYEAPCEGTLVETRTPQAIADALAGPTGPETTGPTDRTVGGFPAQHFEFHVAADLDTSSCGAFLHLWPDPGPVTSGGLAVPPGQTLSVDVVDIDGTAVVLAAGHVPGATSADIAELESMVASIQFQAAPAP